MFPTSPKLISCLDKGKLKEIPIGEGLYVFIDFF